MGAMKSVNGLMSKVGVVERCGVASVYISHDAYLSLACGRCSSEHCGAAKILLVLV